MLALYRLYDIIGRLYVHTEREREREPRAYSKKIGGRIHWRRGNRFDFISRLDSCCAFIGFFFALPTLYDFLCLFRYVPTLLFGCITFNGNENLFFFFYEEGTGSGTSITNVISYSMDEGHDFESLSVPFRQQRQLLFSLINVLTTMYEPECLYVSCKTHVTPLTACRLFFSFFFYCCFLLILLLVFRLVFCFVDLSAREIRLKHTWVTNHLHHKSSRNNNNLGVTFVKRDHESF